MLVHLFYFQLDKPWSGILQDLIHFSVAHILLHWTASIPDGFRSTKFCSSMFMRQVMLPCRLSAKQLYVPSRILICLSVSIYVHRRVRFLYSSSDVGTFLAFECALISGSFSPLLFFSFSVWSLPQILSLYDNVNVIDVDKVVEYVRGLQQEDGSFAGDKWGELNEKIIQGSCAGLKSQKDDEEINVMIPRSLSLKCAHKKVWKSIVKVLLFSSNSYYTLCSCCWSISISHIVILLWRVIFSHRVIWLSWQSYCLGTISMHHIEHQPKSSNPVKKSKSGKKYGIMKRKMCSIIRVVSNDQVLLDYWEREKKIYNSNIVIQ